MTYWYGAGSTNPYLWLGIRMRIREAQKPTDPPMDPDPHYCFFLEAEFRPSAYCHAFGGLSQGGWIHEADLLYQVRQIQVCKEACRDTQTSIS